MITKNLIAASALVALTLVPSLANAGVQPSDSRWWPRPVQSATMSNGEEALASAVRIPPHPVNPAAHQYRGGPRSIH